MDPGNLRPGTNFFDYLNANRIESSSFVRGSYLWHYLREMKTNQNMRRFLGQLKTDSVSALSSELSSVLDAGFVEEKGCELLASKARGSAFARTTQDETGYECFINHLHVEDLGEALEFARLLHKALADTFTGSFVVIVAYDGREATVRFHRLRANQTWLSENLDGYLDEGIAVLDSN